jgi:HSP20 family molecular chaperone IbpA
LEENYTETPDIITFVDSVQSKLMIEISLVSVEKEDINLMMDENGCFLSAPAEGGVEYVATLSFLRAVKPSEAKAVYTDSFLKIEVPFKSALENFVKVPIEEIKENPE